MLASVTTFADCVAKTFCLTSLLHYDTGSKLGIAISCGKCLKENSFFNKSQPYNKYIHQLNYLPLVEEHLLQQTHYIFFCKLIIEIPSDLFQSVRNLCNSAQSLLKLICYSLDSAGGLYGQISPVGLSVTYRNDISGLLVYSIHQFSSFIANLVLLCSRHCLE